jgi:O-antigen/teichoic acid export membrane protein/GNAT superfamily N-acetyltransferase
MRVLESYFVNVAAQAIGRICSFGANFVVFMMVARIGGPEFFGQYSYVLAFLAVVTMIAEFGMTSVLGRDIAQVGDRAELYWGNSLMLRGAAAIVTMAVGCVAAYWVRPDLFACLIVGIIGLPFLASRFFDSVYQVYGRPWYSAAASFIYGVSYLGLSLAAFAKSGSLLTLITMYVVANMLYCFGAFYLAGKMLRPVFVLDLGIIKNILRLAAPLGVSSLFTIISSRAPVFLLAKLSSDTAVAIYNAAFRFFELAVMLAVMLAAPLLPVFSRQVVDDREGLKRNFIIIFETIAVLLIPAALVTPLVSEWILTLCFGQRFAPSAPVLNILAWVAVLAFYSMLTSNLTIALGVVHFSYWNTGVAALISVLFNYLMIPHAGPMGSAWTAGICEVFLLCVTVLYIILTVGNIFRASIWLKICFANLVLWLFLYMPLPWAGAWFRVGAGLAIYVIACFSLQLLYGNLPAGIRERLATLARSMWRYQKKYPAVDKTARRIRYVFSFLYRTNLMMVFSTGGSALNDEAEPGDLPEGYRLGTAVPADYEPWAQLLNSDGFLGSWSARRIHDDIMTRLIEPNAALLLYYHGRPIGSICCFHFGKARQRCGLLMWFIVEKEHRKRGLGGHLWRRALQFFAAREYTRVYLQTDSFRYSALQFYLSKGGKPVYDSFSSLLKWRHVRKHITGLNKAQ